jgi:hypothetical protein
MLTIDQALTFKPLISNIFETVYVLAVQENKETALKQLESTLRGNLCFFQKEAAQLVTWLVQFYKLPLLLSRDR